MIFSPSCEYALQALICLAGQSNGDPVQVKDIAKAEDIPKHFLAKILNYLNHEGLVESVKGPGGGFRLSRPADQIRVGEVLDAYRGVDYLNRVCILGLDRCQDKDSCALHKEWKRFRQSLSQRVKVLTVQDMLRMREAKRKNK